MLSAATCVPSNVHNLGQPAARMWEGPRPVQDLTVMYFGARTVNDYHAAMELQIVEGDLLDQDVEVIVKGQG